MQLLSIAGLINAPQKTRTKSWPSFINYDMIHIDIIDKITSLAFGTWWRLTLHHFSMCLREANLEQNGISWIFTINEN